MHAYKLVQDSSHWDETNGKLNDLEEDLERIETGRPERAPTSGRIILTTCVYLLVALAALIVIFVEAGRAGWLEKRSPVPKFSTEVRALKPLPSYEEPAGWESDALWSSKLPGGKGFFTIHDAETYGLPPGLPNFNNLTTKYGVTWAHEYHCLDMMRQEFWKAVAGSSALYGGNLENNNLTTSDQSHLDHITHCFDYIRQLIMCRGDMTIEWSSAQTEAEDGSPDHIDGYGIPHQCVKFDEMYDYMDSRPAKDTPSSHH